MIGWAALALGAAGIAATEARAARRERAVERAHPPEGRLVEVDRQRVHYVQDGTGPDLVLLHGASGSTRDMTFGLLPCLSDRYRVTVFDRPGLGYSDRTRPALDRVFGTQAESPLEQAAFLQAAARRLGIVRPIVLGQSLGGAVALAWALADPKGTAAIVDVAGVAMPWPGSLDLLYRVNGSTLGGALLPPLLAAWVPDRVVGAALRGAFAPNAVPEGYPSWFPARLALRRRTLRANMRQVNGMRPHIVEMSAHYASLPMPIEIVHGEEDTIVPPVVHSQPLSRIVPGANLVMLPGVGHMPHHTAPEAVIAAIDRARGARPRRALRPRLTQRIAEGHRPLHMLQA